MIKGIGVDIIEIARIEESLHMYGEAFSKKLFTAGETDYCRAKANPAQHFAARFAAKEACSKALGTGWSGAFDWKLVEVLNDVSGKPAILLHGILAESLKDCDIHLSLSHSNVSVVAFVVIESTLKD
jgi:holo-[acyl-carrier protein] synthase